MLYKRKGMPEINEIVLCKVTKIFPSSVFVDLLEYGRSGIVHISEVSPGRIRNLRDYVSVGRQIVCKILRIDEQRGHIDLSLRRVNSNQRREKLDEIKQELKAEQLVKFLSKKLKLDTRDLYRTISSIIFKEYSHLHLCFWDVVSGDVDLIKLGFDPKLAGELKSSVLDKFKPQEITITGEIKLQTYHEDGVERIKEVLQKIEKVTATLKVSYLGAGRYKFVIVDKDYEPAEKNLQKVQKILEGFNDKLSSASFERDRSD